MTLLSPLTNRAHRTQRIARIVGALALFVLAACGGAESTSRNRTLNSTLCYDTQDEKDTAIADAEKALSDLEPPVLEDSSPADNNVAGNVAFIGPMMWWRLKPTAEETSTTSTTVASTSTTSTTERPRTIGAPTNLTAVDTGSAVSLSWNAPTTGGYLPERYAILWQGSKGAFSWAYNVTSIEIPYDFVFTAGNSGESFLFGIRSDNDTERLYSDLAWVSLTVAEATTTETTIAAETTTTLASSAEESTETTVPLIGDAVRAALEDELELVKNAPLCSDLETETVSADDESTTGETLDSTESISTAECVARAGYDLNLGLAFVQPCDAATLVRFDFATEGNPPVEVVVSDGSRATASWYTAHSGFSFTVFVGEEVAVTGSVEYPQISETVTVNVPCDVTASLTRHDQDFWRTRAVLCDGARIENGRVYSNSPQDYTYRDNSTDMLYGWELYRWTFDVYIGEQQIMSLDVAANVPISGSGTYESSRFSDVFPDVFSGQYSPPDQESTEELGDAPEGYVTCSAMLTSTSAEFDCVRELYATLFWRTNAAIADPNNGNWLYGDEQSRLEADDVLNAEIYLRSSATSEIVLQRNLTGDETIDFLVPDLDTPLEDPEEFDVDLPYYEGVIVPQVETVNNYSFTIPADYLAPEFRLEFYAPCELQNFSAVLQQNGTTVAQFVDMAPFNVLVDGLCGAWLYVPIEIPEEFSGATFDVLLTADTDVPIVWNGTVELSGLQVSVEGEPDEGIQWEEFRSMQVTAAQAFEFIIPAGGRWVDAQAPTDSGPYCDRADPYLILLNSQGDEIDSDDDGGYYYGLGENSSRLVGFLPEGNYTLIATTYQVNFPQAEDCVGQSEYELRYRIESAASAQPVTVIDEPPTGVEETTTTVPASTTTTTTTTVPASTTTTTTTTTVPASTTNTPATPAVVVIPVDFVIVRPLDEVPEIPQPLTPDYVLPVAALQESTTPEADAAVADESPTTPSIGIPSGVHEIVCDSGCVTEILEASGVDDGTILIQIGDETVSNSSGKRSLTVPISLGARSITVTVTPSDGSAPVTLSRDIVVMSPRTFPTNLSPEFKVAVTKTSRDRGIQFPLIVLAFIAVLAAIGGLTALRRKNSPTA